MINFAVKTEIKFPNEILTQDDLLRIAEQLFIPTLQRGIDNGVGVDGAPLPAPEPSSIAINRQKTQSRIFTKSGNIRASAIAKIGKVGLEGMGKKVLIDTGKLRRAFWSKKAGKNSVVVTIEGDRLDIGKALQIDGVRTKHGKKFYKFFGISDGMEISAKDYLKTRIAQACGAFNGRK